MLLRGSPFAFPCGVAPGFDQSHFAAKGISKGHGFLGVASSGNFINLLSGAKGALSGTPTASNETIGPCTTYPSSTNSSTFAGQSTANDAAVTIAGILNFSNGGLANHSFFVSSGSNSGWNLGVVGGNKLQLTAGGVAAVAAGWNADITATTGFAASSINANVSNFVFLNFSNGVIYTSSTSGLSPIAPDGSYVVGTNNFASTEWSQPIAALAFIPAYLSMQELVKLAFDPWPLWYPNR